MQIATLEIIDKNIEYTMCIKILRQMQIVWIRLEVQIQISIVKT